jgi:hypothetical protein
MITPALPLVQASVSDSPTDGWRIIGLIAITLLTIVILALIFRPNMRHPEAAACETGPNGDDLLGKPQPESLGPRLLEQPAPVDTGLAAERLKQIVDRVTAAEAADRRRLGDRRLKGRETTPRRAADDTSQNGNETMDREDHGTISEQDADQAGLDAAALEEQINRLFGIRGETGNIVQFTPRKSTPTGEQDRAGGDQPQRGADGPRPASGERSITQFPVDMATREAITATVQELLFCANVGELLHGFALYTDRYLFQFMDESHMSEDDFREAYSDIPAKDPSEWIRIDEVSDFVRLDDDRIRVRVRYIDGAEVDGTERFILRLDPRLERWLIDDIQAE